MIIGCGAVILFLFIAPAFGLNKGMTTAIAIVAMLACHLFMASHHHKETKNQDHSY